MFAGQGFFETLFVLIAVAAIPVMLFAKPWHIMKQRKNANVSMHIPSLYNKKIVVSFLEKKNRPICYWFVRLLMSVRVRQIG